uniref:F-box/LRR-repeat protein 15/At3g58940/PEG3-like LRR domain-containing protein n=1 Tax=Oryza meridionalis TaxID=40149 RepID=A0A0E0FDU3_9ORYZ
MEGAAAAAAAGLPMVKLRGGDGVEFSVQARRLAELAPGHIWDLPAIESGDIYDTVQLYRMNAERFTSRATGGLLPQGVLNVQTIFAERVHDLDTLGHLTRAAIVLGMEDLKDECYNRMLQDHQMGPQEVKLFLQNALGHPKPQIFFSSYPELDPDHPIINVRTRLTKKTEKNSLNIQPQQYRNLKPQRERERESRRQLAPHASAVTRRRGMEEARARVVAAAVARMKPPWATLTHATPAAVLAPPVGDVPHAGWRGLPDDVVARVLVRLPVVDLFRLGYLFSPRWLDIWRAEPLYLHDRQFVSPRIAAADVADAIANVLELHVGDGVQFVGSGSDDDDDGEGGGGNEVVGADGHDLGIIAADQGGGVRVVDDSDGEGAAGRRHLRFPGGIGADDGVISDDDLYGHDDIPDDGYEIGRVYSFRVETTRWRADHLHRWCAALQRGRVREVTLTNLTMEGFPDLPQGILDCGTSLKGLHVFFFTVEADHIDPLVNLRVLGVYGCAGMIRRALRPESEIRVLTIDFNHLGDVVVQTTRLRSLWMFNNVVEGTVIVHDAIQFRDLHLLPPTRPSRIFIGEAPSLRSIGSLDLLNTVFVIKGIVIQAGMVQRPPKMRSVRILGLRVNYTEMGHRVPREIEQILKCFPCLEKLEIMRDDEVTPEEGLLEADDEHIYQENNFFRDLGCFSHHLRWIYLTTFRGGRYELALGKAILDEARAGTIFRMVPPPGSNTDNIFNQLRWAIEHFRMTTPNHDVRDRHRWRIMSAASATSCVAAAGVLQPPSSRRSKRRCSLSGEGCGQTCAIRLLLRRRRPPAKSPERARWPERMDRESIVASDLSIYPPPPGTRTLATPHVVLAPPPVAVNQPRADWRGLPDAAVSLVLDRLPVVDLFRLGYLFSPRWLDIWRARPLYLHDHQFTTPPIPAANVADAITNVLHHHVGNGVQILPVAAAEVDAKVKERSWAGAMRP